MRCKICQKEFTPSKYRPNQQVCPQANCQKARQVLNERAWRKRNLDYFKCLDMESAWRKSRCQYNRAWRIANQEYLKEYEKTHQDKRKEYMRGYMRQYRLNQSVNRGKS
ncbi:MAG: hypothetical protein WC510_03905 [Candidatus Omnitrophota bacterium]